MESNPKVVLRFVKLFMEARLSPCLGFSFFLSSSSLLLLILKSTNRLAWNDIGASGASAVINLIKSCTSLNSIKFVIFYVKQPFSFFSDNSHCILSVCVITQLGIRQEKASSKFWTGIQL